MLDSSKSMERERERERARQREREGKGEVQNERKCPVGIEKSDVSGGE